MRIQVLEDNKKAACIQGQVLTVYGVEFANETRFMVTPDDHYRLPNFLPASFTKMLDARASRHWVLRPAEHQSNFRADRHTMLTFPEWVRMPYFYSELVENEAEFWPIWQNQLDRMDAEFRDPNLPDATYLEDEWWMCPQCDDAFKHPEPSDETGLCRTCWTTLNTVLKMAR